LQILKLQRRVQGEPSCIYWGPAAHPMLVHQ
jgi:hypothetical protein